MSRVNVYGARPQTEWSGGHPVLAGILAGLAAAAVSAVLTVLTKYFLGVVTWGTGALVGYAMGRSARTPSTSLGLAAVIFATTAVILGRMLTIGYLVPSSAVSEMVLKDSIMVTEAFLVDMREHRSFSPELQTAIDQSRARHDTSSSARKELRDRAMVEAAARAAAANPAERERVAQETASGLLRRFGPLGLLPFEFNRWDLLWGGLAILSAWKLARRGTG